LAFFGQHTALSEWPQCGSAWECFHIRQQTQAVQDSSTKETVNKLSSLLKASGQVAEDKVCNTA